MASPVRSSRLLGAGKWLALKEISFCHPRTKDIKQWEVCQRTTDASSHLNSKGSSTKKYSQANDMQTNVVVMLVQLEAESKKSLVMVKQYRPAVNATTLELPAGLLDNPQDSNVIESACRELREECGITMMPKNNEKDSTCSSCCNETGWTVSPGVASDPGLSNVGMHVVMSSPGCQVGIDNALKNLEDAKCIETVIQPIQHLMAYLDAESSKGIIVDSRLYHLALGIELGQGL